MSAVTGIGSWPGTDIRLALRIVRDVLAVQVPAGVVGVPYLPELPDRGPGAELIGRTAGLLSELPVDLQPSGWRLVDRPGRDARRTQVLMQGDLDELAEVFDGYVGPLKLQVAGPWTLAAELRVARGERVVADPGACRDLAQSLADGLARHVERVQRLVPGARLVVQVDEPSLPAVLQGRLRTSSGYGRHRAVDPEVVRRGLGEVVDAARVAVGSAPPGTPGPVAVHCCDRDVPLPLLRAAGADAVALDSTLLRAHGWESVAATVEAGTGLWAGIATPNATTARLLQPLRQAWREVGLGVGLLDGVTLTPPCGLAGVDPAAARAIHERLVAAAGALTEVAGS
ncbi:methionine synthase II (cobalamin-independent) [Kineosphaera limosa]|uniref:Uncharacterized protein n=1 Tax=Kineosphaera limosa NBRC 100340 TaxID=1184609 RepID=K6W939_9MICO|nr:hypothetical protein [Kineosphaera limosa]NYD99533.1 methionine synthase II (cobalamin-independent) [Kineosphaera limosa]GAB95710.1 hypothetical protein KILIM_025_00470 [Kineosphaera limosa NBRC 100340]